MDEPPIASPGGAPAGSVTEIRPGSSIVAWPGSESTSRRAAPIGSSDRVLVVEDDPIMQTVAVAMLEHLGFCVDVVDNGIEAVIVATMVPYRAILMDCQIPALDGYETTMEIRGQEGASRSSPIIAVTSATTSENRRHCVDAGMNGVIAKPLNLDALAAGMAIWAPNRSEPSIPGAADGGREEDESDASHTPASSAVLDSAVVDRLAELATASGENLMDELATLFLADADIRIQTLHDALAAHDGQTLIRSAHTLCGASANLGATELSRLCARLATDGAVWGLESGNLLLQAVESELDRVRIALQDVPRLPTPMSTGRP
jgi:two-component system, sensor histidine kinase and response regulator